ncbi:MAG: branched-chain amino acid ABC transporter permease [Erysipelotrichaceae bacterium]|nr:branched-chain amino acid ABC transporter permease [Erysipelotrichaceae bacterium]
MFKKIFDKKHRGRTFSYLMVLVAYVVIEIMLSTKSMSSLMKNLLVPCCCYIVTALALNLCVGLSGELSLGHAGFMSIGAYTGICFSGFFESSITNPIVRLILAMMIAAAVTALFGFLIGIPVLKLSGDYLAIVTLAFCQIIASLINNCYLGFDSNGIQFSFITNNVNIEATGKMLLSGPIGASGTTRISTFTVGVVLIVITLIVIYNLMYSKNGRAIMACRDNSIAALSVGVSVTKTKMLAFVISAAIAGAAGALYGLNFSTLAPAKFNFNQSILILVYVVLGGLGNINGTIIAASLLYILPEKLRGLQDYRMIIYSLVLIAIMLISNNQKFKVFVEKNTKLFKNKFTKKEAK